MNRVVSVLRLRPQPFGRPRGQIAAFMVVLLAVLMFLMMFTVNVGQVALTKTASANAADAASLAVASSVGSISRQLALQLGKGRYVSRKCNIDWGLIAKIISIPVNFILFGVNLATIIIATATAISIAVTEGIFTPMMIRRFNRQFRKLTNLTDQIRENAILTAFLRTVDDPTTVVDRRDIDEDGDATEEISAFADWYDRHLERLVTRSQGELREALPQIRSFVNGLRVLTPQVQELQGALDAPIIPLLAWVESLGFDVRFWMPGEQTSSPLEPDQCPELNPDCGPGLPAVPDQIDWLRVRVGPSLDWANGVLAMDEALLVEAAPQAEELLRNVMTELDTWRALMASWTLELNSLKPRIPWPPIVITDPRTGRVSRTPPTDPPVAVPFGRHPLDLAIQPLADAKRALEGFSPALTQFSPGAVSTENPIYSWQDNRGWHHVQVSVDPFGIPRMKTGRRGVFKKCTWIHHAEESIGVKVTRFDEDNIIGRGWAMRYRASPETRFLPSDPRVVEYGIASVSRARYGTRPNTVRLEASR